MLSKLSLNKCLFVFNQKYAEGEQLFTANILFGAGRRPQGHPGEGADTAGGPDGLQTNIFLSTIFNERIT